MRPHKQGLDYYPLSVDFFQDDCIKAISSEFGIRSEIVIIKVILLIFQRGYYLNWNKDEKLKLLASLPGVSINYIEQIVQRLVKWDFFNSELFEQKKVLTSTVIQTLYFKHTRRRRHTKALPYLVIAYNNGVNVYNNPVNVYNNGVSVDNNSVNVYNNGVIADNNSVNVYNNPKNEVKSEKNAPVITFNTSYNDFINNNSLNYINIINKEIKKNKEKNIIKKEKEKEKNKKADTTNPGKEEKSCAKKEERWVKLNPPTLEEVESYCRQKGSPIDAKAFLAHYTAVGWVYGKSSHKIVNWKACITTWERNNKYSNGTKRIEDRTSYRDPAAEYSFSNSDF